MATIPLTNRFHTTTETVPTANLGSKQSNSDRESFSMQDVVDTVNVGNIAGTITTGQVAFGAATANSIEGNANLTTNGTDLFSAGQVNLTNLNIAPATSTSAGVLGEIRWAADAVYFCIATNVWVKAALTTF
jgi:hypothetical protein|tara:strand:+ start:732 stop:1127 length:396 start_codon:yes stop_codon:yes gene_type:complete